MTYLEALRRVMQRADLTRRSRPMALPHRPDAGPPSRTGADIDPDGDPSPESGPQLVRVPS
jgi:hypothetical protein